MGKFFLRKKINGEIIKNLSVSDLLKMSESGEINPTDEVRKIGRKTWHPASNVKGLKFSISENDTEYFGLESQDDDNFVESVEDPSMLFNVKWSDQRMDGPFSIKQIKELLKEGLINATCKFKDNDGNRFSFVDLDLIGAKNFKVKWQDGRQDGPFAIKTIQNLFQDGVVDFDCEFNSKDGRLKKSFNELGLVTQVVKYKSENVALDDTSVKPIPKIKERRPGTFRRFIVKSTASLMILVAVIGLGFFGIWQAMSSKQRQVFEDFYETTKSKLVSNTGAIETIEDGQKSNSQKQVTENQSVPKGTTASNNLTANQNNISSMLFQGSESAPYLLPDVGPLWLHEELNMPVMGGLGDCPDVEAFLNYEDVVTFPQLFKFVPKHDHSREFGWDDSRAIGSRAYEKVLYVSGLNGQAFYRTKKFDKVTWINFGDRNLETTPGITKLDLELVHIASELGLFGQSVDKERLVSSWVDSYNWAYGYDSRWWSHFKYNQWVFDDRNDARLNSAYDNVSGGGNPINSRFTNGDFDYIVKPPFSGTFNATTYNGSAELYNEFGARLTPQDDLYLYDILDLSPKVIIEDRGSNGISMLSIDDYGRGFIYFDRNENGHLKEIGTWDSAGTNQLVKLRYEYDSDGLLTKILIPNGKQGKWLIWNLDYSNGKLKSITSEPIKRSVGKYSWGFKQIIESYINCVYEYDSAGRVVQAELQMIDKTLEYEKPNSSSAGLPVLLNQREKLDSYNLSLIYESDNEYWSEAILSLVTSAESFGNSGTPVKVGAIRFEQHYFDRKELVEND